MKNENNEFVERIESNYVGDDCIQKMISHYLNNGISILNSDGMTYHYKPNSSLFIDKYISDKRKEQFPYSKIPNNKNLVLSKKIDSVNQLFDFNRVYIIISDDIITEYFVVKDGEEALLATKYIPPVQEKSKYMTRDEVLELLKTANGGMFAYNGACWKDYTIPTEERLLEWYKEEIIKRRKREQGYYKGNTTDKQVSEFIFRRVAEMTIDDVPSDMIVFDNAILVTIENNEIKSVKSIIIKFMEANKYKVESYDFPITIYSLEHMKKLEQTNFRKTFVQKISRLLNKTIDESEIKKAKQLVLQRKK